MGSGFILSEVHIRYAMQNTTSCGEAARWLRVNYNTFKTSAKRYIDPETGMNLFDLHKHNCRSQVATKNYESGKIRLIRKPKTVESILNTKQSLIQKAKKLSKAGFLPECCDNCGFNKKRDFDYAVPLILWFYDHDPKNLIPENIRLLCYNCYFLISIPKHVTFLYS